MKTHKLDVTVFPVSSAVTVSDPKHHIKSGDRVIWTITWSTGSLTGDLLVIELDGALLTGGPIIDATVDAAGHSKDDELPYAFFLKRGDSTTRLHAGLITPFIPTATDPYLVLDTNGPPPGGGGGTGHCPQGPKDPSGRGRETPDCP
jgi:hypothetical protein